MLPEFLVSRPGLEPGTYGLKAQPKRACKMLKNLQALFLSLVSAFPKNPLFIKKSDFCL